MHEMISAKKSPTKMEIRKASFVTLVLLCIAPIRTSKYPGRSIWRRNKNCDYFRIEVTIRKMRRPSGARTTTPIHNCSSILVRPDWQSELRLPGILLQVTSSWTQSPLFLFYIWPLLSSRHFPAQLFNMTRSQMLRRVDCNLPAKFWRIVGGTKIVSR